MDTFGTRLKAERKRLGLTQEEFAHACQVQKGAQLNYELGKRFPDTEYLRHAANLDADMLFLVLGQHDPHALEVDELELLKCYRVQGNQRKAALLVLLRSMIADGEKAAFDIANMPAQGTRQGIASNLRNDCEAG